MLNSHLGELGGTRKLSRVARAPLGPDDPRASQLENCALTNPELTGSVPR